MSDRPESPPAGVTVISPEEAGEVMRRVTRQPPSALPPQGTALLLTPYRLGTKDYIGIAGLIVLIPLALLSGSPSAAHVGWAETSPAFPWGSHLKWAADAAIILIGGIALGGWLDAAFRRTWLLADAGTVRILARSAAGRKYCEFSRKEIEAVKFSLHQKRGRSSYEVSLRLQRGEDAGVFRAGTNRAGARYAAFALSQAAGLPVRSDTPLNLPDEVQYPFSLPAGRETGIRVKNRVFARSAALSGEQTPPEELALFDAEDREFRAFLPLANLACRAGEERDSCFAVRESFRSVTAVILTAAAAAAAALAAAGDPNIFLEPAVRLFSRERWLEWAVLADALPLAFLAGLAAAVIRIPRWLLGQRWYVFLGESMMVYDRCLTIRRRKTVPRAGWTEAEATAAGFGYRAVLHGGPLPGTAAERVTAGVFSSREAAAWFAGVLRTWLGHG